MLQDPQTTPALQRLLDTCSLNGKIVTSEIKSHYLASELGRMIPLLSLRLRSTEPSPWLLFALLQPGPGGFGRVPAALPAPNGCSLISTSTREIFIAIKTALKVPSCWARHKHSRRWKSGSPFLESSSSLSTYLTCLPKPDGATNHLVCGSALPLASAGTHGRPGEQGHGVAVVPGMGLGHLPASLGCSAHPVPAKGLGGTAGALL